MKGVQFFAHREVREVGERRYYAAGRRDLRDECVLACPLRPAFEPIRVFGKDAGEKAEPKLCNHTGDNKEPGNKARQQRGKFPTIESPNRFNRCNPKEGKEW